MMVKYRQRVVALNIYYVGMEKFTMPAEKKAPQAQSQSQSQTQREVILVNILERLSGQIQQFDARLEKLEKNQLELPVMVENAALRQGANIANNDDAINKLNESMHRYRSDMLGLVNRQDRLFESLSELYKRQDMIIGAQEVISRDTARLDERFGMQEKAINDNATYAVRHGETISKEIEGVNRNAGKLYLDTEKYLESIVKDIEGVNRNAAKLYVDTEKRLEAIPKDIESVNRNAAKLYTDTERRLDTIIRDIEGVNRNAAKLYIDTEKQLKDENRDTKREIDELRKDTMKRLSAFDKIEETLEVLMIRTEPPEKKPFILIRAFRAVFRGLRAVFRAIGGFFGNTLPAAAKRLLRRIRRSRREKRER